MFDRIKCIFIREVNVSDVWCHKSNISRINIKYGQYSANY